MARITGGSRGSERRAWAVLTAGAALLGAAAPSSAAAKPTPAERNVAIVERIEAAYDRDDCKTVLKLGVPLADYKGDTGLPEEYLAYVYDVVTGCEAQAQSNEAAYRHALKGTALDGSSDYLWRTRLVLEVVGGKHEAAVATIEAMTQGRGAALNSAPLSWTGRLNRDLEKQGKKALRLRLLRVLGGDSYAPDEAYGPADWFRKDYAAMLAEGGKTQEARAIVAKLETPGSLAAASLDPRLRHFLAAEPDIRAAVERSLARHREAIARYPDRLDPLLGASRDLRELGRPAEALQLLEPAVARIGDPSAFTDRSEQLNWLWNEVAEIHSQLGHYDEAVAAFRKGSGAVEGAALNVSQVINLAHLQLRYGHGEEALKTLAVFETSERKASAYGQIAMRYNRACAYAVAKRPADAAADLAYIRAHSKDGPGALGSLLLCLGDMDGAAADYIRRLDDPETRSEVLLRLSDYDDPPVKVPLDPGAERLPSLKARADVKAAIARAGGIRRFRVQGDTF